MSRGKKNAYWCPSCHGYVVTVDIDDGVTPMFMACRVKGEPNAPGNDCRGMMESRMYPPEPWPAHDGNGDDIPTEPTYEWYKPTSGELNVVANKPGGDEIIQHVQMGGLLMRPVTA